VCIGPGLKPYTHYLHSWLSVRVYGHDVTKHKTIIWGSGDEKFSTTTRATIAKAVLANPKETANQFLYVSSFEITMNEFVASLKKATGVNGWDIEHIKGDEQIEQSKDLLAQGKMWPGMGKLALAATVTGGLGNDFATDEKLANEMLGLPRENLDEVVTRVLRDGS
jgi:hypothetical protein